MVDVSVIIPVFNAGQWLDECLESIYEQRLGEEIKLEVSLFLDSCTDDSEEIVQKWVPLFHEKSFMTIVTTEDNGAPKGVGYAKNRAVEQSKGEFLCFMDADDKMYPDRIMLQYKMILETPDALVGSGFSRDPADATARYTRWANRLTPEQLLLQAYTSHGPTVIMPTWFLHRTSYTSVGGFSEAGRGEPEDLLMFYALLRRGGGVRRVPRPLLLYRHHGACATLSVPEERIWSLRVAEVSERVLRHWPVFTIWNGGRQGRRLYRSLSPELRGRVAAFCDVDPGKVGRHYTYEHSPARPRPTVPILHFTQARPPFIVCVKLDLSGGAFEANLASLDLEEGKDYVHFN